MVNKGKTKTIVVISIEISTKYNFVEGTSQVVKGSTTIIKTGNILTREKHNNESKTNKNETIRI